MILQSRHLNTVSVGAVRFTGDKLGVDYYCFDE